MASRSDDVRSVGARKNATSGGDRAIVRRWSASPGDGGAAEGDDALGDDASASAERDDDASASAVAPRISSDAAASPSSPRRSAVSARARARAAPSAGDSPRICLMYFLSLRPTIVAT